MKIFQKITCAALAAAMMLGANVFSVKADQSEEFDEFLEQEYKDTLASDYMTLHYGYRDYKSLGIEKPEPVIGVADKQSFIDAAASAQETIDKLKNFDRGLLTKSQQEDYDAYLFEAERSKELNDAYLFGAYFTPGQGLISNLLTNFTEFVFYEKEDVEDYLSVLASVPQFIEEAIVVTQDQASQGYFMSDSALDSTLDQIDRFVSETENNQLIVIFENNIDAMAELSEAEKNAYKEENRKIVFEQYIPCYEKAGEELEKLRGSRSTPYGLYYMEGGEEYYASLVKEKGSTDKSVSEMLDECTEFLEDALEEYYDVLRKNMDLYYADEYNTVDFDSAEEILAHLQSHLEQYPEGPEVTYKASYLDPSVANDNVVAYYLEPPVDALTDNVIKINGDAVSDINDLYMTLSHEGFPGHLYQITWYMATDPNLIRTAVSSIGYTEGWAMYSEAEAMEWSGLDEPTAKLLVLDTEIGYIMNAAADLGVNGLGWKVGDLEDYLDDLGLNSAIAQDLMDFVIDDPGMIVPYGYGMVRFLNLREKAEKALGKDFDVVEFNEVLLTYGSRPFEQVEADVDEYIKAGGEVPEVTASPEPAETDEPDTPVTPVTPSKKNRTGIYWVGGIALAALIAAFVARSGFNKKDPFDR